MDEDDVDYYHMLHLADIIEMNVGILQLYFGPLNCLEIDSEVDRSEIKEAFCHFIRSRHDRFLEEAASYPCKSVSQCLEQLRKGHLFNASSYNARIQNDNIDQIRKETIELLHALLRTLRKIQDSGDASSQPELPSGLQNPGVESISSLNTDIDEETGVEGGSVHLRGGIAGRSHFDDMELNPDMSKIHREYFPELARIPVIAAWLRKYFRLRKEEEDPVIARDVKIALGLELRDFLDYIDIHGTSLSNLGVRKHRDNLFQAPPLREREDESIVSFHTSLLQTLEQKRDELEQLLTAVDSFVEILQTVMPDSGETSESA